jgi:hypothetical protein
MGYKLLPDAKNLLLVAEEWYRPAAIPVGAAMQQDKS